MALAVEFDGLRGSMDIGGLFVDIALLSFCSLFPSMATNNGRFATTHPRKRQLATSLVSVFSLFPSLFAVRSGVLMDVRSSRDASEKPRSTAVWGRSAGEPW
jgi:hypothetical protein